MSIEKIRQLLKELEHEVKAIKPDNEESIRLLLEIELDIEQLVKSFQEDHLPASDNFSFTEAAVHFEQSHPKAAAVLGQITQSLANLGI